VWNNRWLGLRLATNGLPYSRWGLSVGRRTGSAVVRNLVRRRLREIIRLRGSGLAAGWDIVLAARAPSAAATYQSLEAAFLQVTSRAGMAGKGSIVEPDDRGEVGAR
jgi:ribonuclease P protein component